MVREVRNYCFESPVCFPPLFLKKFQGKACGEKIVRKGWYRGSTMMMKLSIVGQVMTSGGKATGSQGTPVPLQNSLIFRRFL